MNGSQERNKFSPEKEFNPEALAEAAHERREQLREDIEKKAEQSRENLEDVKREALEKATSIEEETAATKERQPSPAERRNGPITKAEREASYKATMNEIQTHMSPASRTFSKVIHNKTVEKVSEVAGNTVARPNAMLAGAVCAFLLTLGVYVVAKNTGYLLSGFETIGAFVLGWIIGVAYDFVKTMVTGQR